MILLFLIVRRTPTIRELIVATPLSLSSPSANGLSAHAPAHRLERSDFVPRRKATFVDRDRDRREWAGKRALPSDIYRRGLRPERALPKLGAAGHGVCPRAPPAVPSATRPEAAADPDLKLAEARI
jgi:hypothetical protein